MGHTRHVIPTVIFSQHRDYVQKNLTCQSLFHFAPHATEMIQQETCALPRNAHRNCSTSICSIAGAICLGLGLLCDLEHQDLETQLAQNAVEDSLDVREPKHRIG